MEVYARCPEGHRQNYKELLVDFRNNTISHHCPYCKKDYKMDVIPLKLTAEIISKEVEDGRAGLLHKVSEEDRDIGGQDPVLPQRDASGKGGVQGVRKQDDKNIKERGKDSTKGSTENKK